MTSAVSEPCGVGEEFVRALAARDFRTIEACFHPDVRFRALIPPGVREASDASGAVSRLRLWFGDADSFELLWAEVGSVVDRTSIAYRIRLHNSDGWQTVEQRLYCDVGDDGRIRVLDLLCAGFLPEEESP